MSLNAAAEQNEFTYYRCKKKAMLWTKWLLVVLFVLSREWFILHFLWIWASILSPRLTRFICMWYNLCAAKQRLLPILFSPLSYRTSTSKCLQQTKHWPNFDFPSGLYLLLEKRTAFQVLFFPIISCSMMEESFRKMFPSNIFYV